MHEKQENSPCLCTAHSVSSTSKLLLACIVNLNSCSVSKKCSTASPVDKQCVKRSHLPVQAEQKREHVRRHGIILHTVASLCRNNIWVQHAEWGCNIGGGNMGGGARQDMGHPDQDHHIVLLPWTLQLDHVEVENPFFKSFKTSSVS